MHRFLGVNQQTTMIVSEETEDGVSSSKAALTEQNESQADPPQTVDPPVPSCVSMKSDSSRVEPIEFKAGDHSVKIELKQRPDPPAPSCVSMRSDRSKSEPIEFKAGDRSVKIELKQRPDPPAPRCVKVKRDQSRRQPMEFKDGRLSVEQSFDAALHSHHRRSDPPRDEGQTYLDSVFMVLEKDIIGFVRSELRKFKKTLSPGDSKKLSEDDEAKFCEEEEWSSNREALLRITLTFLRRNEQEQLADSLQSKTCAEVCQRKLKSNLKNKCQCLFEGIAQAGNPTLLNQIYTELHIIEGESREVNVQHEVRQIEAATWKPAGSEAIIRCEDIFKPGRDKPVRTVVTKGVAGIGKTVLTQKYTLDWAEEKNNLDVQFMFLFSFRELNLLKDKNYSLLELIYNFFTDARQTGIRRFEEFQVVFIFDGLDECQLPLDFHNNPILTDVTESSSVDVLLTNLIQGNLLPSARLWITTRPAAANQIPPDCVDMVTEVRGFTDPQKEEYFKRRYKDEQQAGRITSHVGSSRSLHIMCHIPVFCWITGTVLDHMLKIKEGAQLPRTLTDMYIHFLVVQTKQGNTKYHGKAETDPVWNTETKRILLSLAKLAFEQLQKGNLIFYETELNERGIDVKEASVYSGLFTEIFKEESGLSPEREFCFVHQSIQEFLAALYVYQTFINTGVNLITRSHLSFRSESNCRKLYERAVDMALKSPNGHLDLFIRFLLGLSQDTNQTLLRGLLKKARHKPKVREKLVQYIKKKIKQSPPPERSINLFHCLNELNDHSLEEEIQQYLRSGSSFKDKLSPSQWSALVFILLSSQKDLEVFDLKNFSASEEGLVRLLEVVKTSNKSLLSSCGLSAHSCEALATVLISSNSNLRELDLSNNNLQDKGVKLLSFGLRSQQCKLEILRLSGCLITEEGCGYLASALSSNPSHLRELDLSFNHPGDKGRTLLTAGVDNPNWKLENLKIDHCGECRLKPSPMRYFCELTFDPNTAHRKLLLTNNKKVQTVKEELPYPDHPERFDGCRQVLCSGDGLSGRSYWEVQWRGIVRIGVTYKGIRRRGDSADRHCCIGWNDQSWSLFCSAKGFTAWHNNTATDIETPAHTITNRVGVYLDWTAGTLSFYCFPSKHFSTKPIHLHTFQSSFTEPLYAAFGFGDFDDFGTTFTLLSSSIVLTQTET